MLKMLHCSISSIPAGNVTAQAASPGTLSTCFGTQPWEKEHPGVSPFRIWAVSEHVGFAQLRQDFKGRQTCVFCPVFLVETPKHRW